MFGFGKSCSRGVAAKQDGYINWYRQIAITGTVGIRVRLHLTTRIRHICVPAKRPDLTDDVRHGVRPIGFRLKYEPLAEWSRSRGAFPLASRGYRATALWSQNSRRRKAATF